MKVVITFQKVVTTFSNVVITIFLKHCYCTAIALMQLCNHIGNAEECFICKKQIVSSVRSYRSNLFAYMSEASLKKAKRLKETLNFTFLGNDRLVLENFGI